MIWKSAGQTDGNNFVWLPVSMQAAYMFLALVTAVESWGVTALLKMAEKKKEIKGQITFQNAVDRMQEDILIFIPIFNKQTVNFPS